MTKPAQRAQRLFSAFVVVTHLLSHRPAPPSLQQVFTRPNSFTLISSEFLLLLFMGLLGSHDQLNLG